MSRYRDLQFQVGDNYPYLFTNETEHLQILMFKHIFIPNVSDSPDTNKTD